MDVKFQQVRKKTKLVGSFSYSDPAASLSFSSSSISSLTFNGNQAHFTGTAKLSKKSKLTFTVDVADNSGPAGPGTLDTFSIQVSNGYSASGNLLSGNLTVR